VSLVSSAQILPKVEIIIAKDSFAMLEANPFTSRDVLGTFRGDTGLVPVSQQFDQIELNFRGAYALQGLINDKNNTLKRRNWKVKMLKSNLYMNRRELNFNYQNHVREFMTYYLMRKAQVPLAENRFVLLSVNGVSHGLYMQIVDIDDKSFLESTFKSKKGDLYKSAYDTPADPNNRYWADFSYLGSEDSNYFLHYNKKTNNDGAKETDYSSVRKFTEMLNWTPDESIGDSIKKNFAWENFIRYLVVSNFVSNWDGYPQRPKNSWLYHNPADKKWNFVPWDMDATFNTWNGTLPNNMSINMMGKYCSVFYYMDKYEPYTPGAANETKERPLVWRMMKIPFFRNYYVEEYKKALNTYLSKTMIDGVLDSISAVVKLNTPLTSWNSFATTVSQTKTFVTEKHRTVNAELEKIPSALPLVNTVQSDFRIYPIPASDYFTLTFLSEFAGELQIDLLDITGKWIKTLYHEKTSHADIKMSFTTDQLQTGNYFVRITNARGVQIAKLIIIQ
jgi:spore coat protein CotH